ncbi:hypothetical protein AYO45_04530 [Gammaproteobacteria bacterium SCGC AG-212-F23]|nr:hypothetical protein AYO45_04530 [Gammaproteobacteria bacterium SCGC AG-212-F23]
MATDEQVLQLREDFYKDGFGKVMLALALAAAAIVLLIASSCYLVLSKPKPVNFAVGDEWRVLLPVPVDRAYLSTPDLLQWVSTVLPAVFTCDFVNYTDQIKKNVKYFTDNGQQKYADQLSNYANNNTVQNSKLFVSAVPTAAPFILNQGVLEGRYAWWVQMPMRLDYINYLRSYSESLTLQVLVVRIPTLNNLTGVAIENIIVQSGGGKQPGATNG